METTSQAADQTRRPPSTHVMDTWHAYIRRLKEVNTQSRQVSRLPGANSIYLSEATGCPRKATLRLLKYPSAAMSAQSSVNMASGIKGEEKVALVLEANGWYVERQKPVRTRFGNGRVDLFLYRRERDGHVSGNAENVIVEVKTSTFDKMDYLPARYHLDQALLYKGFLGGALDIGESPSEMIDTELVYLLRESHGDTNGKESIIAFSVEWDQERWDHLIGTLSQIDTYARNGTPIPLDTEHYAPTKVPCQYPGTGKCSYWQHCWGKTEYEAKKLQNMPIVPRDTEDDGMVPL